jgi:serine/threonine protein kinase
VEQTPWLDELALAVADGRPIDWLARDARLAADIDPGLIGPLRLVERVVRAHRETTFDIELEEMSVRPPGVPASDVDTPPEQPDEAAVTWGPLTILERIGGGSYGDVYRAHDRRLDRVVALKLLRRRDSAQTRRASAVIEEGRLMARVRHPNVVMVYGAERIDGRVGLWMEYLEGQTLAEELRIGGPFSEAAIVEVARAMCGALAAVHAAGLMHHDLKAQNVIRTTDGRIVLTDFGAGRQVITDSGVAESRQVRGTPAYLAPEVLAGRPASLQSEVYSLGVLLHYLATGVFPDRTLVPAEVQSRLAADARLSTPLSDLIVRCLAEDPNARFPAMPDVAAALTPMTPENSFFSRFARRTRTHAWLWLIPTILGFTGASLWSAMTPNLYRSSGLISVVPPKVPEGYVPEVRDPRPLAERIPSIRNEILSRTRLERIILDLDLYAEQRRTGIMEDTVGLMRRDIGVTNISGSPAIAISFTSTDPRMAKRVAERLVALFIDESTRDRKQMLEGTDQFLESTLTDMRYRLETIEAKLRQARRDGGEPTTADVLELDVAKEGYRQMLVRKQETVTAANLERREIGEQFRQIDSPTLPEAPIAPPRGLVKSLSTLSGLLVGLILVVMSATRGRSKLPSAPEPSPAT